MVVYLFWATGSPPRPGGFMGRFFEVARGWGLERSREAKIERRSSPSSLLYDCFPPPRGWM
jgi:hypothetical protein